MNATNILTKAVFKHYLLVLYRCHVGLYNVVHSYVSSSSCLVAGVFMQI